MKAKEWWIVEYQLEPRPAHVYDYAWPGHGEEPHAPDPAWRTIKAIERSAYDKVVAALMRYTDGHEGEWARDTLRELGEINEDTDETEGELWAIV